MTFDEDIFIVDCWLDTDDKENDLISLITKLREFDIPILLTGHYPVKPEIQKLVDYYLFDKDNPILPRSQFREYDVASVRWTQMSNCMVENSVDFHHDYAIWTTMKNSFNFAKYLGKKYIHFLEYDNLIDTYQYKQSFLEKSRNNDAVLYEYNNNSIFEMDEYCATFIFSIKTDVALNMINRIKDKKDYFMDKPGGWQLERVFLKSLKEVTDKIFVSKYIANNNELNTQAVWNRDGVLRNGEPFQIYLASDDRRRLNIHLVSGFFGKKCKKDILIEVTYRDYKNFITLAKDGFHLSEIGEYVKGETVKVYYQGVEVFSEILDKDFEEFFEGNKIIYNNKKCTPKAININFVKGPFIEILDDEVNEYHVDFIDTDTGNIVHSQDIKSNMWVRASRKYNTNWTIKANGNEFNYEYIHNLKYQRVFISFESKSLGDTIAWIPYVDEFRKKYKCEVICSSFHNKLFVDKYPNVTFVEPGSVVKNIYAQYCLGYFYSDDTRTKYDTFSHPIDPKTLPLQQIASDILGLDYVEIQPKLGKENVVKKKQVSIAIHSTAQSKYWNNPTGWQDVVNYLKERGYSVLLLSSEENGYMGNKDPRGVQRIKPCSTKKIVEIIQESELFIGISSGLSWVSWASGTPTILISGFTDDFLEPKEGVNRIINKDVCHGCWGRHNFDPGDWKWCPEHKGTDRHFECTKEISSEMVINEIKNILNDNKG